MNFYNWSRNDPLKINKYGKKVGTTLKFWEDKGWMEKQDPYGWVQWYCEFYLGRRSVDDERQISRWKKLAGPNGRFRKWLVTQILKIVIHSKLTIIQYLHITVY